METIMIIEDDLKLSNSIGVYLEQNGYKSYVLNDFSLIENDILSVNPNLILLDINLGKHSGYEICMGIRRVSKVPILFITGRDSIEDEVKALKIGGDDYIRKPFSREVLLARIKRQLETHSKENLKLIRYKNLVLEIDKRILRNIDNKKSIELPSIEFQLLFYLFTNSTQIVDRGELMDYLWENRNYVDPNALNVNLSRL